MNDQTGKQIQTIDSDAGTELEAVSTEKSAIEKKSDAEITRQMMLAAINKKSMGAGVLLTCLFGGFGVFYASLTGGIVMTILETMGWIATFFTFGFGVILLIPLHLISLVWTIVAISNHNKKLVS